MVLSKLSSSVTGSSESAGCTSVEGLIVSSIDPLIFESESSGGTSLSSSADIAEYNSISEFIGSPSTLSKSFISQSFITLFSSIIYIIIYFPKIWTPISGFLLSFTILPIIDFFMIPR